MSRKVFLKGRSPSPKKHKFSIGELESRKKFLQNQISDHRKEIENIDNDYIKKIEELDDGILDHKDSIKKYRWEIEALEMKIGKEKENMKVKIVKKRELKEEREEESSKIENSILSIEENVKYLLSEIESIRINKEKDRRFRERKNVQDDQYMYRDSDRKPIRERVVEDRFASTNERPLTQYDRNRNQPMDNIQPSERVFIGSLPRGIRKTDIQEVFGTYGINIPLHNIYTRMGNKRNSQCPIYSIVTCRSIREATQVINQANEDNLCFGGYRAKFSYSHHSKDRDRRQYLSTVNPNTGGGRRVFWSKGNTPTEASSQQRQQGNRRSSYHHQYNRHQDHEEEKVNIVYSTKGTISSSSRRKGEVFAIKKRRDDVDEEEEEDNQMNTIDQIMSGGRRGKQQQQQQQQQTQNEKKRTDSLFDDIIETQKYQYRKTDIDWDKRKVTYRTGPFSVWESVDLIKLVLVYGTKYDWATIADSMKRQKLEVQKYWEENLAVESPGFRQFWNQDSNRNKLVMDRDDYFLGDDTGGRGKRVLALDLHLLNRIEAVHMFWMYYVRLNSMKDQERGYCIVGKGVHSRGGIGKLKNEIVNQLESHPLYLTWEHKFANVGVITFVKKPMKE